MHFVTFLTTYTQKKSNTFTQFDFLMIWYFILVILAFQILKHKVEINH